MEVYLFLGLHNSYFPPDIDFQVLVQVVSSKLLSDKSQCPFEENWDLGSWSGETEYLESKTLKCLGIIISKNKIRQQ